jgi:hypothetical protein
MFKMKYLINRMQVNTLSQQVWWPNGKVFTSILMVNESNLTIGVFVVNSGKLIEYSYVIP